MLHTKLQCQRSIGSGEEDFFQVFTIYGYVGHVTQLICINFHSHSPLSFHMSFGSKSPICFCKTSFNFEIWVTFDVFTIYGHGGHLGHATRIVWTTFHSPDPWRLHMKFGYNWPNSFRAEVVWKKFMSRQHYFCHSRASNSEVKYQIWPKFKLVWDFMPVLDTCKFKEVVIKTQGSEHFPNYNSMGKIFVAQGLITLKKIIRPGPN